jgi:hypothetical protein
MNGVPSDLSSESLHQKDVVMLNTASEGQKMVQNAS